MPPTVKQPDASSPRYREIEELLVERIRHGTLKPGERLDSTDALAQELDTGAGTINQALAALASRGLVTRRPRIGTVVSDNVRSIIGQANAPRSTAIYAVLVPDLRLPTFSGMVHHIQEILRSEQVHVSVFNIEGGPQVVDTAISRCIDDGVDAVLLIPPFFSKIPFDTLLKLKQSKIPVVTCWRSAGIDEWPLVEGSSTDVITTATQHLLDKDCRRVALLKDVLVPDDADVPPIEPLTMDCDPAVQLEFMQTLVKSQIMPNPEDMIRVNHGMDALRPGGLARQGAVVDALVEWLEARPEIDGLLCTYDIVAGLALEALSRLGRRVPEDVAVTGGGSLRAYSWYFAASLTSMDHDQATVAQLACDLFKRLRQGEHIEPGHVERVPCKLVEGETTAR